MRVTHSHSHALNTYGVGLGGSAEIILEVEDLNGPAVSDLLLVLGVDDARRLANNLLLCIRDTEPKENDDH